MRFWVMTNLMRSFLVYLFLQDGVLIQFDPPDDEHLLLETCRGVK
jgi:hypothetical protein